MNSVLQSLASSRQLLLFIDSYLGDPAHSPDSCKRDLPFTLALRQLLEAVNGKYGLRGREYSTKLLLAKMPNGPKQNFFGYNQEDAQEFYQLIMEILEKEYKLISQKTKTDRSLENKENLSRSIEEKDSAEDPIEEEDKDSIEEKDSTKESSEEKDSIKESIEEKDNVHEDEDTLNKLNTTDSKSDYVDAFSIDCPVMGCNSVGVLGTVYVPAHQVDPNLENGHNMLAPLLLVTPVDGVTAERIGCLTCGEVGGIRYSVTSGLSLNLPSTLHALSANLDLQFLLNEWIKPEIIDQVNCNRCGMSQTRDAMIERLAQMRDNNTPLDICNMFQRRLDAINAELSKACISDEQMEKLTIEQMIRKSKKSKQIYFSRPPPLLLIHINRLVFDTRTYSIVKNSSNVQFPVALDLRPWIAEPGDINMDARRPLRKQDEREPRPASEMDLSSCSNSPVGSSSNGSNGGSALTPISQDTYLAAPDMPGYSLVAVISHYGTHNYGHYICYRRLRGTWWRISDELVYVVTEAEVISGQGTFMLFYEINDGYVEDLVAVSDEEDEEQERENLQASDSVAQADKNENSSGDSSSDSDDEPPLLVSDSSDDKSYSMEHSDSSSTQFIMGQELSQI